MKKTFISCFVLLVFFASCNDSASNSKMTSFAELGAVASSDDSAWGDSGSPTIQSRKEKTNNANTSSRKLIKTGNVSFKTEDLEGTKKRISEAVKSNNAYISSDNQQNYSYQINQTLTVRIPTENFDKFLVEISKGVEKFDSKSINIKDVTAEFLDVQTRIKTKKELEKRYLELLKKANKVTDMLEVEREIGRLRTDIESFEGRLKYLKNQVGFSTLNITYYKTTKTVAEGFGGKFSNAFSNGWENLLLFFIGIINLWAFFLFGGILFVIIRKYLAKRRKK